MKTFNATLALTAILSVSPFLSAQENPQSKDYFTVKSEAVTLTSVVDGKDAAPAEPAGFSDREKAGGGIANAGLAAWSVINNGAPSAGYSSAYASAIPGFMFNWGSVTGWKGPKEMVYGYKVTNLMGVDVIDVKYKISFFYGGTEDYSGGEAARSDNAITQGAGQPAREEKVHGRYITNFTVQPVSVNVKWGWHFDLSVRMSDPMNIGTKLAPVAALQASLNWIQSTPFSTNGGTLTYNVDGLGNFRDLNREEKELTGKIAPVQVPELPSISWN